MIKIQTIRAQAMRQVLNLLNAYCHEPSAYTALKNLRLFYLPIHVVSQLLPPQWQFVPAIYVAASRDRVLGLIRLSQDGARKTRWQIEEVIIDPEASSYDVGTQLVNYVINRYGGGGVQTFIARVFSGLDTTQDVALGLFKSCGFRHCSRIHYFTHQRPGDLFRHPEAQTAAIPKGLRPAFVDDAAKLLALHTDMLPAETRHSLEKSKADFDLGLGRSVRDRLNGQLHKQWVVEDVARDVLTGSVEFTTHNFQDFTLSVMIHSGWTELYEDLLRFGLQQILLNTAAAKVHLETYDFTKTEIPVLNTMGFQQIDTAEVLVKDYWIPLEDKRDKLSSPMLLFTNKTTPAVNAQCAKIPFD